EDVVRVLYVTGVQTCALPICLAVRPDVPGGGGRAREGPGPAHGGGGVRLRARHGAAAQRRRLPRGGPPQADRLGDEVPAAHRARSEERRVGKECRSRWTGARE